MNKQQLTKIKQEAEGLKKAVAAIILSESAGYDDLEGFFSDLFSHGCVSGMVGALVYYTDTHKFAKKHIEEILELVEDLESETGQPVIDKDKGDKLNFLAWLGFEETARRIYQELGGENW